METEIENRERYRVFRLVGMIFLLVSVVLLVACGLTARYSRNFAASAERAEGTVIDLSRSTGKSQGNSVYHPVVSYRTAQGEEIEFISSWGSRPAPYRRGAKVTVLYDAAEPQEARIESFFALWGASVITGGLAVVFGLLGLMLRLFGGRAERRVKVSALDTTPLRRRS